MLRKVNFEHGTRDGKHDHILQETYDNDKSSHNLSELKTKASYKIRIMSEKGI